MVTILRAIIRVMIGAMIGAEVSGDFFSGGVTSEQSERGEGSE